MPLLKAARKQSKKVNNQSRVAVKSRVQTTRTCVKGEHDTLSECYSVSVPQLSPSLSGLSRCGINVPHSILPLIRVPSFQPFGTYYFTLENIERIYFLWISFPVNTGNEGVLFLLI